MAYPVLHYKVKEEDNGPSRILHQKSLSGIFSQISEKLKPRSFARKAIPTSISFQANPAATTDLKILRY